MFRIHQAKRQLSRLIGRVNAGEEIVIARAGRPVAHAGLRRETGKAARPNPVSIPHG